MLVSHSQIFSIHRFFSSLYTEHHFPNTFSCLFVVVPMLISVFMSFFDLSIGSTAGVQDNDMLQQARRQDGCPRRLLAVVTTPPPPPLSEKRSVSKTGRWIVQVRTVNPIILAPFYFKEKSNSIC